MELNQAIQKLIDENDVAILKERRFLTLLNEHLAFDDMPFAAQMLRQIYNNGYGTKIHEIYCNKNSDDVSAFLSELRNNFGFDIVMLRKVFGEFGFPIVSKQKAKQNKKSRPSNDMEVIRFKGHRAYRDEYGGIYSYPNCDIFYKLEINVQSYSLVDNTKVIYSEALMNCKTLKEIVLPNSITIIDNSAFSGCSSLQEITIPDSTTSIGDDAFRGCSSLQQVTIPSSVTNIGNEAFRECSSLQQIFIPQSVTNIGHMAFRSCDKLTTIYLPSLFAERGGVCEKFGLNRLIQIKSSQMPEQTYFNDLQVLYIDGEKKFCDVYGGTYSYPNPEVFYGFLGLNVAVDLYPIGMNIFTSYSVREGTKIIDAFAFSKYATLRNIKIPDSIKSIGDYAFNECSSLQQIDIPLSVTNIGHMAFRSCECLEMICLPALFAERGSDALKHEFGLPPKCFILKLI